MESVLRFLNKKPYSQLLFGPRGSGKTSWAHQCYPEGLFIDLLDPALFMRLKSAPEKLRDIIYGNPEKRPVIVDEIQKIPELLDCIHLLIESDKTLQFILTGSSARKLKHKNVNLLGGRAILRHMHPYMASELGGHFSMDRALEIGMLPIVWAHEEPFAVLRSYAALYMNEEVQMEGLVRNVGNFARFLEAMSFSHAGVLNLSNIARECGISAKTVSNYLQILEDLLLCFTLPVFNKRAKRLLSEHPKFYYFDSGIFGAIRPKGFLDSPSEIRGAALEGLIAQHLRAWCDYTDKEHHLYYWRTRAKLEIDFIIYGENGLFAFEVKHSSKVKNQDLKALKAFQKDYPDAQCALLYLGNEKHLAEEILCLPCDLFLRELYPNKLPISIK